MSEQNKRQDVQDAVEDAFGFNFRSLKTLRDLFVRPAKVFAAYAARDRETYTPALRIWGAIIGVQVLVSALWGGWEGLMRWQFNTNPATRANYEQLAGERLDELLSHYGDAMGFVHPISVALCTSLSIFVLGWMRKGLTWPARLNIAMGVLSAGSVLGLIMLPMLPYVPALMWSSTALVSAAYFITFLRGAPGVLADTAAGAWGKAALYTLALLALVILASMVSGVMSIIYAMMQLRG